MEGDPDRPAILLQGDRGIQEATMATMNAAQPVDPATLECDFALPASG